MGEDRDDVLDDLDGWLVWPEIETAVTLQEMIITAGASVPVFLLAVEFSSTRRVCPF